MTDPVVLELRADVANFNANVSGSERLADRSFKAIEASAGRVDGAMKGTGRSTTVFAQQFSQMGQQVAAGTNILQALAIQLPDIAVGMQAAGVEAKGLAGFFLGPWGIALATAAALAVSLADDILKIGDAADESKNALDRLTKARAAAADKDAEIPLGDAGLAKLYEKQQKLQAFIAKQPKNSATGQPMFAYKQQQELLSVNQQILTSEDALRYARAKNAEADSRETAAAIADRAKLAGATNALDRAQAKYNLSIREAEVAFGKSDKGISAQQRLLQQRTAAERALNQAQDANRKKRKTGTKATYDAETHQDQDIARLEAEELRAKADLTDDVEARADLERELLAKERDAAIARVNLQSRLSNPQKQAQLDIIDRIYGPPGKNDPATGDIVQDQKPGLKAQLLNEQVEREKARLDNEVLRQQADALQAQAAVTENTRDRRAIGQKALDIQQEIERNLLDQALETGQLAGLTADQKDAMRNGLADVQAANQQRFERQNESPWTRYMHDLRTEAENVGDAFEEAAVRGADRLTDSLAEATKNALGLHGVLGDIVGDFIEILLKQQMAGGSGGILGALGSLFGGGAKLSGVNYGAISNAAATVTIPGFAKGTNSAPGGIALVGEEGPEVVNLPRGAQVIPNHMLRANASRGGGVVQNVTIKVDAQGALLAGQVQQMVAQGMAQAAMVGSQGGSADAQSSMVRRARRRIPG